MSAAPTFTTQILGQTEKALNAILERELAGTGLTERQWVTLVLVVVSGGTVEREQLTRQLAGALKVSEVRAHELIAELAAAQLIEAPDTEESPVKVTDAGRQLHSEIRAVVSEITERMWGDLPADELATTGRVLSMILERANAELTRA